MVWKNFQRFQPFFEFCYLSRRERLENPFNSKSKIPTNTTQIGEEKSLSLELYGC